MGHTNVFAFVNVLCEEHKTQSTTDGYKSNLCFLIIANRKTINGWFDFLFVFPIEWHQTGQQRAAYTQDVAFLFLLFSCCGWKTKIVITDHISIFLFCFWIRKKVKEIWFPLPYFYSGIGKPKTKGRYIQQMVIFGFSIFHFPNEKNENRQNGSYFYFRVSFVN